jgi:CO/xanthine dehydrogenase FAD-binding subunit
MIDLQYSGERHIEPLDALVDVTRVVEMTKIEQDGDSCIIGAAVTHTAVVKSALLEARATCLVESCGVVGGPQVRNVGTLGGNVAHALPAGDGTTSLVALGTEADVAWGDGRREWLPITQLYRGPGVSALTAGHDLLIRFRIPLSVAHEGSAFKRVMRPHGVALPILGCAIWVRLDPTGTTYEDAHICVGPIGPTPTRVEALEEALRGQPADADSLERIIKIAYETIEPRTSKYRATAEYRSYMVESLLRETLPLAVERARTGSAKAQGVGMG